MNKIWKPIWKPYHALVRLCPFPCAVDAKKRITVIPRPRQQNTYHTTERHRSYQDRSPFRLCAFHPLYKRTAALSVPIFFHFFFVE
jgi:hypothetical protein